MRIQDPEKWITLGLFVLLGVSIGIMYVDITPDFAVAVARGVCVVLVLVLIVGVIFPVRRRLERQRLAAASKKEPEARLNPSDETRS